MLQTVNTPGLHLPLQKRSGELKLLLCPEHMALKRRMRCCARQAAGLQVQCVPYGDAETGPEIGSDPANSRDC